MSRKSCSFWFWHDVLEEFWCFRLRILDEILMLLIEKHAPWKECKERVSTLLIGVFLFRASRPLCWWLMSCSFERIQIAGVNIVDCCVSFSCFAAAVLCWWPLLLLVHCCVKHQMHLFAVMLAIRIASAWSHEPCIPLSRTHSPHSPIYVHPTFKSCLFSIRLPFLLCLFKFWLMELTLSSQ